MHSYTAQVEMRADSIGLGIGDELIGSTVCDLEDRWFDPEWQKVGSSYSYHVDDNMQTNTGTIAPTRPKPIEERDLVAYDSTGTGRQGRVAGTLTMWVEILTPTQAANCPPLPIGPPAKEDFEIHVVVWKSRFVPRSLSDNGHMNDLFCKLWMEGDESRGPNRDAITGAYHQETDTHWRSYRGVASWNWRCVFKTTLPSKPKFNRLHVQLWDQDLGFNDTLGECQIDLTSALNEALQKGKVG
jgi:hypothetical protein